MCVKRLRGWDENVWEPNLPVSTVELTSTEEVLDKTAYTMLNSITSRRLSRPLKGDPV